MAKKNKEVKPIPIIVGILMILAAFAVMGWILNHVITPPAPEASHVDDLGNQTFDVEEEESVAPPPPEVEVKEYMADAEVGNAVYYGKYEQDGNVQNGAEPIEWIVLDKDAQGLMLISRYCLDCKPYNETRTDVNWQSSSLRAWLNGEFYSTAFDETEQSNIIETEEELIIDPPMEERSVKDKVSILSTEKAQNYYEYNAWRVVAPTAFAVKQGVYTEDGNAWWWLRESLPQMNEKNSMAEYVYFDGSIISQGFAVDYDRVAVRPVIWVSVNAEREDLSASDGSDLASEEASEEISVNSEKPE